MSQDPIIDIAVDQPEDDPTLTYMRVVLREDQLDLIADAVIAKLDARTRRPHPSLSQRLLNR